MNVVKDGAYHRVASGKPPVIYRVSQRTDDTLEITVPNPRDAEPALADVRHRLAEGLPYQPVVSLGESDPIVAELLDRFLGFRPPLVVDPFESIITSISAQQVNLKWAATTRARLVHRFGNKEHIDGVEVWAFPAAGRLAEAEPSELRSLQFTWRKSEFIIGVARAAVAGKLEGLDDLTSEEVASRMMALRGVGRWTADWLLARCLGRPNAVAAGDLGVRKAVSFHYLSEENVVPEEVVREAAAAWGDAANWVTHLLLEALARA